MRLANQLKSYFIKRLRGHFPQPPRGKQCPRPLSRQQQINTHPGSALVLSLCVSLSVCGCVYIQHKSDQDQPVAVATRKTHRKIFTRSFAAKQSSRRQQRRIKNVSRNRRRRGSNGKGEWEWQEAEKEVAEAAKL